MAKNPYFDEDDEDIVEESDGWVTSPFANITKPPEGKKRVVKKPVVEEPVEYFEEEETEEDIAFPESEVSISEEKQVVIELEKDGIYLSISLDYQDADDLRNELYDFSRAIEPVKPAKSNG